MYNKLTCLTILVVLLALVLANTASAELVGWWKLDDGSGTIAVDSSANGNDGTLEGDPQWVDGWIGGALEFDGDDYVDTGYTEDLAMWTISCWVTSPQAPASGDPSGPVHRENNYQINWTHTSTDWQGSAGVNVGGWRNATFGPLSANTWYHLAATYDGEELRTYTNGNLIASNDSMSGAPDVETNSLKLARHALNVQYFTGTVDDVKIYNHVLSEFDLHAIAAPDFQQAWKPSPIDGETEVLLDEKLVWNQGIISNETFELYDEHHIYIGTDFNDVNAATEPTAIVTNTNEYSITLDYDTTYYWRVDEVSSLDPNNPIRGDIWSFTSANFIVVENFEDYNDFEPDTIYLTWVDGFGDLTNGSTAGYANPIFTLDQHFVETTIVHGGLQSMPLFYDNAVAGLSEVTKTLTDIRDWTQDDVLTLTLFYYGNAGNTPETMYVALDEDAIVTNADPRAALNNEWTQWDILLQDFADQGVNLADVDSISIGFGDKAMPLAGGSGVMFFDDIRLYRSLPIEVEPEPESVDPGTANLKAYYAFENNVQDTSGNARHGTIFGDPIYVNGPTGYGMALEFDGIGDYVTLPIGSLIASASDITVACWVNFSNEGGSWQRLWDFGSGEDINMFVTPRIGNDGALRFAITVGGGGGESNVTAPATLPTGWHHVTAVIDSASMTMLLYQDGRVVAEGTTATLPSDMGATTQNYIGLSQYAADALLQGSVDEFRIYDRALERTGVLYLAGK